MTDQLEPEPKELLVSVNDDPHMYVNNVGKPLKRIAIAILFLLVTGIGLAVGFVLSQL